MDESLDALSRELPSYSVVKAIRGVQGTCFVLARDGGGDRVVAKLADTGHPHTTPSRVAEEFRALQAFSAAADEAPEVIVPRPVKLLEEASGYVMEFVEGEPLSARLAAPLDAAEIDTLAERIAAGLRLFHRAAGTVYGDFHSGNVLVDRTTDRPVLLDPTAANPIYEELATLGEDGALAADLAYWVYCAAGDSLRVHATSRRQRRQAVCLVRALLRSASSSPGFSERVRSGALAYVEVLRQGGRGLQRRKNRVLAVLVRRRIGAIL